MTTWEQRMAARAARLSKQKRLREQARIQAEEEAAPGERVYFKGNCDVCGAELHFVYNLARMFIDYGFDEEGRMYTWIQHSKGADPDCDIYSSRVTEYRRTKDPQQPLSNPVVFCCGFECGIGWPPDEWPEFIETEEQQ